MEAVAEQLDWSTSKYSRILRGESGISTGDLRDWLDAFGITDDKTRTDLIAQAKKARRRQPPGAIQLAYPDVFTDAFIGLENEAHEINIYDPELIPGLLQTPEYAAALMRAYPIKDQAEIDRRVAARIARQALLTRDGAPQRLWVVLAEAALRIPVGSEKVMAGQLRHLVDISERLTDVDVQILPADAGAHAAIGEGAFVVLSFPEAADGIVVYKEYRARTQFLEDPEDTDRYTLMWSHLLASALDLDSSTARIREAATDMER